jgi:hypothetical protein
MRRVPFEPATPFTGGSNKQFLQSNGQNPCSALSAQGLALKS